MNNSIYNDFYTDLLIENEIDELFRDNWAGLKNAWNKRSNKKGFSYNFNKGKQAYIKSHPPKPKTSGNGNFYNPNTPQLHGTRFVDDDSSEERGGGTGVTSGGTGVTSGGTGGGGGGGGRHRSGTTSVTQQDTFYTYIVGDDNYVVKKVKNENELNNYLQLLLRIQQKFNESKQKNLYGDLNDKTRIIKFKDNQEIPLAQFLTEFEQLIQANITATRTRIQNFQQLRLNEGKWNPLNLFYSKNNEHGFVQKNDEYGRGEWMVSLREDIEQLLDKKYISLYGRGSVIGYQSMIYLLQRKRRWGAILFIPLAIGGLIAALTLFSGGNGQQQQPTQPEQPQQEVVQEPNVNFNYGEADALTQAEQIDIAKYCQAHPNSNVVYHIVGAHNSSNPTINNSQIYQQRANIINSEFAKYGVHAQWDGDYSDNDANANSATVKFRLIPNTTNGTNGSMPTVNLGQSPRVTPQNSVYLTERKINRIIKKSIESFLNENII